MITISQTIFQCILTTVCFCPEFHNIAFIIQNYAMSSSSPSSSACVVRPVLTLAVLHSNIRTSSHFTSNIFVFSIYFMCFKVLSSRLLNVFKDGAETTSSGKLFHKFTTRILTNFDLSWPRHCRFNILYP